MQKPLFSVEPPSVGAVSTLVRLLILVCVNGLFFESLRITAGNDYRVPFSYFISPTVRAASFAAALPFFIIGNANPAGTAYIGNLSQGRASP